jgi:hypothetical protein
VTGRRFLVLIAAAATAALPAVLRAQTPVLLQGIVDAEAWATDTNSALLTRNGGSPAALGRLRLWGAMEPRRGLVLYALLETARGSAAETEGEVEQYGVRYSPSRAVVIDVGRILGPIGGFGARRFSDRNPLIGEPDGYATQYPHGAQVSGALRVFDYRLAVVSLPTIREEYTPEPSTAWRPAVGVGVTPIVGVRLGASYTRGPYLNRDLTPTQLDQRDWRDFDQRVSAAELSVSVGYAELVAEGAVSSYDVPGAPEPVEGLTYYVEGKYTFHPRLYAAIRFGRNDYGFIQPVSPTFWVARKTDFHDEELGIGLRIAPSTLAKLSYRRDTWQVDSGNDPFVGPGGRAVAVQLSHSYDIIRWMERSRLR